MRPFIILVCGFVLALIVLGIIGGDFTPGLAGRIAMSLMLIFTALGHFKFTKGMAMMIPEFIPAKSSWIIVTGIIEIVAGIMLVVPPYEWQTAIFLLCFFIVLLPMNIYAAARHVNYEQANNSGPGLNYLWLRIPLQLFFIGWVYYFAIYLAS